jgi:site-specific DNA-methyltransferase (adenine-specific)
MNIETVATSALIPDPNNARVHDEANIEALKNSLTTFGQQKPIVIDRDNMVVAGNGFLTAAKQLGWEKIAVVRTNLTGDKARAFAIADNRTAELSDWDTAALATILNSLPDGYLVSTGWDQADLDAMLGEALESYSPVLNPEFGSNRVDESRLEKAEKVFDVAQKPVEEVVVVCPHCGEDFKVDSIS